MATIDVTRVAGNIGALNSLNSLAYINNQLAIHQTRLATGKRLNEAADDPAGMNIATTFDVRRQGLQTAMSVIGDAKNLLATSEGGLRKIQDILVKMRNKALEAQSGTIGDNEKQAIQDQLKAYRTEIDQIAQQTKWNNTNLLVGTSGSSSTAVTAFLTGPDVASDGSAPTMDFQFKATGTSGSSAEKSISDLQGFYASSGSVADATGLGLNDTRLNGITGGSAAGVLSSIDNALNIVKQGISQVGASTSRLTFKEEALAVQYTNTESAYNRIMNANMAEEQVEASKYMILQQTATAMLAQANTAPQFLLTLFR
jgi:flagellin